MSLNHDGQTVALEKGYVIVEEGSDLFNHHSTMLDNQAPADILSRKATTMVNVDAHFIKKVYLPFQ
ncbi:hypothetical protein [Bacillus piscicola]|uniref:hypothetical protein n=1 Tax=Bacillus piscicola TaxID=1632684 RepID=UPI001F08B640|nr:hypothetical protein [Bacillus piscicola]